MCDARGEGVSSVRGNPAIHRLPSPAIDCYRLPSLAPGLGSCDVRDVDCGTVDCLIADCVTVDCVTVDSVTVDRLPVDCLTRSPDCRLKNTPCA